jgi:metal-responsive CopG/Arc/MetJ family transcriptional regulator
MSDIGDKMSDNRNLEIYGVTMERITVRINQGLKQELEAEAREKGVRPSDVVRAALEDHIKRRMPQQSCLDIGRRIGFIGVYKDTPPDLSTNPAHMKGFGGA